MKLSRLSFALLLAMPLAASAGSLERTGQPISAFFEKGNYAEISNKWSTATFPGVDINGTKIDEEAAKSYNALGAALKFEPAPGVAVAVIYDEPWGVDYKYEGNSVFSGAEAEVNAQSITTIVGNQFIPNTWLYGGVVFESLDTNMALPQVGYANNSENDSVGYIAGAAFEKPQLAMRASLTYRSKIKHDIYTEETVPVNGSTTFTARSPFEIPQSVTMDFQTAVSPTTLLLAGVRWVNWKEFVSAPVGFSALAGRPIVSYNDDQFTYKIGVGQKLTDKLSGIGMFAYRTGVGEDPISMFGPYEDSYTFIGGGKYKFGKNVSASALVAYTLLSDAEVNGSLSGKFEDSDSLAVVTKLGWNF